MIKKLSSNLINQIAAGEVVDDPQSIVKELLENSIDALSSNIEINLINGGLKKIIITDDGNGIVNNDISKAFERFATSKIKELSDLSNIRTLGFRGEALPSISSISEIILKSKNKEDKIGREIKIIAGKEIYCKPSNIEKGTIVEIKNIFHNVPARRKFLKSENYEYRKILSFIKSFSLGNYKINLKLTNNNKVVYDLKSETLIQRINNIYKGKVRDSCIKIKFNKENYSINGFIGNLSLVKRTRVNQFVFINTRLIKSQLINISIFSAYRSLISRGEFPFFVLFLSLPADYIDINVHPKKLNVKFKNELQIQHIFKKSVSDGLKNILHTIPNYQSINYNSEIEMNELQFQSTSIKRDNIIAMNNTSLENIKNAEIRITKTFDNKLTVESSNIFQIHNKYIVTEIKSGMIIIDQHVAHERVLYEKSRVAIEGDGMTTQKLLFPKTIKFDPEEYLYLLDIMMYLKKIGFEFRDFGENTIIVEGSPNYLPFEKEEEVIKDILEQYRTHKNMNSSFIDYISATYACKAAIKAGDKLNDFECRELVDQLFSTKHPYYCPHGRPIIVNLTIDELDKRFERH